MTRNLALIAITLCGTLSAQSNGDTPPVTLFGATANPDPGSPTALSDVGSVQRVPDAAPCNKKRRGEFAATPIPVVNPTIGNGIAGAVLYMTNFGACTPTPPSTFALGGMWTSTHSWAFGGGANLILRGDLFRITVGGGNGDFHYRFYGIGNDAGSEDASIAIGQHAAAFLLEPKMRVFRRWYLGPRYHLVKSTATLDHPSSSPNPNLPVLPPADIQLRTAALGLRAQHDSRDSQFYPLHGSFFDQTLDFFEPAFGGNRVYKSYLTSYSKFLSFGPKNVLAMHGSLCTTWGQTPFYDLCQLGMSQDLRGYAVGRYQDHRFLSAQVEYRRELFWRLGGVAFIGAGEVGKTFADFTGSNLLPGGGVGLRFLLARESHVNLRLDYAVGRDSHALYVGISEAF